MSLDAAIRAVGIAPEPVHLSRLAEYGEWLRREAAPAGGLGPDESVRVEDRHLADSIVFALGWLQRPTPRSILDVGSGVGLPGIPLAILHPSSRTLLVDRSGRRVRLARRAVRVLGLENVEVVQADAWEVEETAEAVVARASLTPARLRPLLERLVAPGGVAVVGGSTTEGRQEPVAGFTDLQVPEGILEHPASLRIMARP